MRPTVAAICLAVVTTATNASQIKALKTGTYSGEVVLPPHRALGSKALIWVDIQGVDQAGKVTAEAGMEANGALLVEMKALEGRVGGKTITFEGTIHFLNNPGEGERPLEVEILNEAGHLKGKLSFITGNFRTQREVWEFDVRYVGNVIGEWQGVQGTSERLELGADQTMTIRDPAGKVQRGIYSCGLPDRKDARANALRVRGRVLQYKVIGANQPLFSLAYLAEPYMILQEPTTHRHLVYMRVQDGKVPPPNDVKAHERLILGKWKAVGQPPNELVEFKPDGTMVETGPANIKAPGPERREFPGVYQIKEGVMEFTLALPARVPNGLKTTIVRLKDDELALLDQAKNRLRVYRRDK